MTNFMIGPIPEGLQKQVKPYAIAENAFEELTNAYQWRGRIVRRQGYTLLGRLANNTPVMGLRTRELFNLNRQQLIAFDTTDAYGFDPLTSLFTPLPSVMPTVWSGTNYQFFFTTNYAGAFWATNFNPGLHGFDVTDFSFQAGTGPWTVNVTAPGNTFQVGDIVYFLNISGAGEPNNLIFAEVITAGDPTFTVEASEGGPFTDAVGITGFVLSPSVSVPGQDGIRYYGTLTNGDGWANYNPPIDPNNALAGCLLIFPYRGYLVFLNTWEGNDPDTLINYGNRARWTQIGTPFYAPPIPTVPSPQTADGL